MYMYTFVYSDHMLRGGFMQDNEKFVPSQVKGIYYHYYYYLQYIAV